MTILITPNPLIDFTWHEIKIPDDVNLLELRDEELEGFSLPRRYDPIRTPRAHANWVRALSSPVRSLKSGRAELRVLRPPVAGRLGRHAATTVASHNWSGYCVQRLGKERITSVQGIWRVPMVLDGRPPGPVTGEWKSSVWVGLDGYLPASRSMPQIGTEQRRLADGTTTYSAWVWWWGLGQPLSLPPPIAINIDHGNLIYAQVQEQGLTKANLLLKNLMTGETRSFTVTCKDFGGHDYEVEGRTAEWVLEAPTHPGSRRIFTLPDYQQALFLSCNCVSLDGTTPSERQPDSGTGIRMVDWDHHLRPGKPISVPRSVGVSDFYADYTGP